MNGVRQLVGLYKDFILADDILKGASKRQKAFKASGNKQLNHVRGTDGWFRSMLVLEVRLPSASCLPYPNYCAHLCFDFRFEQ